MIDRSAFFNLKQERILVQLQINILRIKVFSHLQFHKEKAFLSGQFTSSFFQRGILTFCSCPIQPPNPCLLKLAKAHGRTVNHVNTFVIQLKSTQFD